MQVNKKQEYNTTFGTNYTKNSIKTLKKFLPELTNNEEFEYSKMAINTLLKAKKRNDSLLVNIFEDKYGFGLVDFEVKHLNSKSGIFKSPVLHRPHRIEIDGTKIKSDAEIFLEDAEFINSEKFVDEANRVLFQNYKRQAKLPLWKKLKESFIRTTKINDWGPDLLEDIDTAIHGNGIVIIKPDGSSKTTKGLSYLADCIKEFFNPTKPKPTPFQVTMRERKEELAKLIDKLTE